MKTAPEAAFAGLASRLDGIRSELRDQRIDGWLLYDLHARNLVAGRLLGLGVLTRRYFVMVPADGEPRALVHGIEEAVWDAWPWERVRYVGWRELLDGLKRILPGAGRVAMEVSPEDAVPSIDLVPAGVVELVRAAGAEVVSSGDLVSRFHSVWSERERESHMRAAAVLAATARLAFARLGEAVGRGETVTEGELRSWVLDRLSADGCGVGADSILAGGARAADPHYHPGAAGAELRAGEVVLLDLWAKTAPESVFADQTWMAYLGDRVPDRITALWREVCRARNEAIDFIAGRWRAGEPVLGHEVDDVARRVLREAGHDRAFIHRTGHSIDRDTHGMGPNLDNLETRELRRLIPGIGFSVEPGVYIPGDLGLRTEVNVYLSAAGPEVTTPDPQNDIFCLLARPDA